MCLFADEKLSQVHNNITFVFATFHRKVIYTNLNELVATIYMPFAD